MTEQKSQTSNHSQQVSGRLAQEKSSGLACNSADIQNKSEINKQKIAEILNEGSNEE